jgi:thiamine biosynthesis lipoprotein
VLASDAFPALGTTAALAVTEESALPGARAILDSELAAVDRACSRFRPDSELSRLNAAAGGSLDVSDLLLEALEVALSAAATTDGLVDPTVGRTMDAIGYDRDFRAIGPLVEAGTPEPNGLDWTAVTVDRSARRARLPRGVALDLGATAKALAADRCARRISEAIGGGVLVSLGGDIAAAGQAPEGGWIVHVTDDHAAGVSEDGQSVSIAGGGLATSSTTVRRWTTQGGMRHHIVDPKTGTSAAEIWRTVSVAASSCVDANVASTAAIIHGRGAPEWLAGRGLPARLVARDGDVVCVAGWPA